MRRSTAAALVALAGLPLLAGLVGCAQGPAAPPAGVVATVDGRPITVDDAAPLVVVAERPPVLRPGDPLPDPRLEAVEHAVRSELFAREAAARHLDVRTPTGASERAVRASALIHAERARTPGLTAASIGTTSARRWYAGHRTDFDDVSELTIDWARVDDPAVARRLLDGAGPAFPRRPGAGVVAAGSTTADESRDGQNTLLARAAFTIRSPGGVGMIADQNGRWWLVRVKTARSTPARWSGTLATTVRTAMAVANEKRHLDRLAGELRSKWAVEVYADRVAAVPLT